jgi:hypothetical protein
MPSKTEQVANLRKAKASRAEAAAKPGSKAPRSSAKKAKPQTPARRKANPAGAKAVRPGSKLETIVALLTRAGGCTTKDILEATEWPAVSVPQQARAAGLKLRKEKRDGVTYYSAA